ncbi:hypothetical protein V8G54_008640 [Vigna mungo]|uniref:SWIM-type domain-containing protein n=1 Tax=Vigna mungo TaxID=3915 RepID=A0AAQ3S9E1_VIGMU
MVCSRAGKHVSSNQYEMIGCPTQANDCGTRIIVSKRDEKWYISAFDDVHTHDLSPTKSRLFRGNKSMNLNVKRTLDLNAEAGVGINKSFWSLVCATGGYKNLEFVEHDVRNYVAKQRRELSKDGDAKALLNYFSSMREFNKDFFFDIDVDDNNNILNVRAACEYFGDVISFDTTYLTNKYDMSFAPFVGVNHHENKSSYYKVTEDSIHNEIREERVFMVTFERDTMNVNCSCLLFEFRDIICRHCVCVLAQEKHTYIKATYNNKEKDPHIERYDNLCKTFGDIAEIGCESIKMTKLLVDNLRSFVNKHGLEISPSPYVNNNIHKEQQHLHHSNIGHDIDTNQNNVAIESPKAVNQKGQPRTKRLKSTSERLTTKKLLENRLALFLHQEWG